MKAGLLAAALFSFSLALFTRHNDFSYRYHPDEGGKVEQILSGKWNFHHPALMLSATNLATRVFNVPNQNQAIAVAGRWVSAAFAALAVAALAILAFSERGWFAGLIAGALLATHHQLFELAHYFKEDTALLFGFALVFLAIRCIPDVSNRVAQNSRELRSTPEIIFLGIAAGCAVSAKYLGLLAVLIGVIYLLRARPRSLLRVELPTFLGVAALTFLLINLPALRDLTLARGSFDRELSLVVHGQSGATRSIPNLQYWNVFIDNTTPALWIFLIIHLVTQWKNRAGLATRDWIYTLFPFAFAVMLSFSPKTNDRYFLPATAMFVYLGAMGVMSAADWITPRWSKTTALALCGGLAIALQIPSLARYSSAFSHDDRREFIAWAATNLPAEAMLAQDARVNLQQSDLAQNLRTIKRSDFGNIEKLKSENVTHLLVSESEYGRFFLKSLRPQKGTEDEFAQKKQFYERLFAVADLLWERPRRTVIYLHPGLRVYRLR
jgi:hypothetical protein